MSVVCGRPHTRLGGPSLTILAAMQQAAETVHKTVAAAAEKVATALQPGGEVAGKVCAFRMMSPALILPPGARGATHHPGRPPPATLTTHRQATPTSPLNFTRRVTVMISNRSMLCFQQPTQPLKQRIHLAAVARTVAGCVQCTAQALLGPLAQ